MPTYRRYKKRFYKRYGSKRSYNNKFSRFNTYRNRSSKAQAYQIYSLNKRVSNIEKNTKPEYLIYESTTSYGKDITAQENTGNWVSLDNYVVTNDAFDVAVKDKTARILKVIIWGSFQRNNTNIAQNTLDRDLSGYVKMLVLQHRKDGGIGDVPSNFYQTQGGPRNFYAPLIEGASQHDRILKYKRIRITNETPNIVNFKMTIKLKNRIYNKTTDQTVGAKGKGCIYLVMSGLSSTAGDASAKFSLFINSRVIYTDS